MRPPIHLPVADTCGTCAMLPGCRGQEQLEILGCALRCFGCRTDCDYVCPAKQELLLDRMREVRGLDNRCPTLVAAHAPPLPPYVPMIGNLGRWEPGVIDDEVVAVGISSLLRMRGRRLLPAVTSSSHLRRALGVRANTRVLAIGVAPDAVLERFWRYRRSHRTLPELPRLGLELFSTPNFSFFSTAPRIHTVWNRHSTLR